LAVAVRVLPQQLVVVVVVVQVVTLLVGLILQIR
jgi:hypothetical protein